MYLATSKDGGKTFSKAEKLGQVTWKLDACPMDGGSLAVAPNGSVFTTWRRDGEIYTTSPKEPAGKLVGQGKQPWTAATAQGDYVVWLADRTSELMLLEPGARKPVPLAAKAADPVIIASPKREGAIVVVWESRESGHSAIKCLLIGKDK